MNENLDLTKILDGCPEGTKFYSSDFGEVTFFKVSSHDWEWYPIWLHYRSKVCSQPQILSLTKNGQNVYGYNGECTLFPSKEQRDWSKFERFWDKPKIKKFDVSILQPFDKVLVRGQNGQNWRADLFSHVDNDFHMAVCSCYWKQCIPYNMDTIHLVGTKEDCSEYYKWWEK